jgi:hypothetical protein
VTTPTKAPGIRQLATKEIALLAGFLFFGLVIMPIIVYYVGQSVFGEYGGVGYGDFFGGISAKFRQGDLVAWFLVFAPYLSWQLLRLMAFAWRLSAGPKSPS